jgi:hypothetical protein
LNADLLDGHHWSEIPSGWDGGTVTNNITIQKANPVLKLYNTNAVNNATLQFYDGVNTANIYLKTNSNELRIDHTLIMEQDANVGGNLAVTGYAGITNGAHGLDIGADCNLYRNAANVLRTGDALIVDGTLTASSGLTVGADCNLLRDSANVLRTNDSLYIDYTMRCNYAEIVTTGNPMIKLIGDTTTERIKLYYTTSAPGSGCVLEALTHPLVLIGQNPGSYGGAVQTYGGDLVVRGGYHVLPESAGGGQVGNSTKYWSLMYANSYVSLVSTGTKPLYVTSTTMCTNLNADMLDGHHWADVPTSQWTAGAVSTVDSPLSVSSGHLLISANPTFTSLSTTGALGVGGGLTVTGSTSLLSYLVMSGNITPITANTYDCGNSSYYWYHVYSNWFVGKNNDVFGCERSKSGQEWMHPFSDKLSAEEFITHQVTKTKYHVEYDLANEANIICTCGKSVVHPCPEHFDAWREKYTVNIDKLVQATGYLALELDVELEQLKQKMESLESEIATLRGAKN